jgi:hypothetical protein
MKKIGQNQYNYSVDKYRGYRGSGGKILTYQIRSRKQIPPFGVIIA